MPSTRALRGALASAALGLGACSLGPSGPPVEAAALCDAVVAAVCEADEACCPSHPSDCETVERAACRSTLERFALDPRLGYDPARAGAFVASLRARATGCWASPPSLDEFTASFVGTGGPGADCTPPTLDGPALRASALSCVEGLACRIGRRADGRAHGTCEARADDACSHPMDCAADRFCDLGGPWSPGVWGTCRPLRADGWACAGDLECASRSCDGTCRARPEALRCLEVRYEDLVLGDDPSAYLRFDEASGAGAIDASGHGRTGALTGGVTREAEGAVSGPSDALSPSDGSLRFSGDSASVRVPLGDTLAGAVGLTLEAWIAPDDPARAQPILELSDGAAPGPHLWLFEAGEARLYANFVGEDGASMPAARSASGAVSGGAWHHVVATQDGVVGQLYLDGARVGQVDAPGRLRTEGDLLVGRREVEGMPSVVFSGRLDEVAVYPRALDPASVARHHDAGVRGVVRVPFPLTTWLAR